MPDYPISLDDSSGMTEVLKSPSNGKHYPKLRLHWDKKYDLPEYGEMTVKFYKCEEVNTDREGKISQTVELDVLTIESVKAEKGEKKSSRKEAEEALDEAMEDVVDGDY